MIKYDNARIENGKVYGITVTNSFNIALPGGENPQLTPTVSFDGISLDMLMGLVWDAFKVKARPALRKLKKDELVKAFDRKSIAYYDMLNTNQVKETVTFEGLTKKQKLERIAYLQSLVDEDEE